MKIIKAGELRVPSPPWPVGYAFVCGNCYCRFEIERGDAYETEAEKRPNGRYTLFIKCPTCLTTISRDRPARPAPEE